MRVCRWNSLRDQNAALTHPGGRRIPRAIHERSPLRHVSNPAPGLTPAPNPGTCGRRSAGRTITCARDRSDCAHPSGGGRPAHTSGSRPAPCTTTRANCRSDGHPVISLRSESSPACPRSLTRSTIRLPYANYVRNAGIQLMYTRDDLLDGPARRDSPVHDEEIRAQFAIRRTLSAMAAEEREMERAMKAFEEDADQAKRFIKAEWRRENCGHDPQRPPAGKVTDTRPALRDCRFMRGGPRLGRTTSSGSWTAGRPGRVAAFRGCVRPRRPRGSRV
jgi:hypothetical protein